MFYYIRVIAVLQFIAIVSLAQSYEGTIKGRILSSDRNPAAFVPVGLKDTKFGTSTDENGNYEFKAPAGKYTLLVQFIGHEPEEKELEVNEGEVHAIEDFTLRESSKELQEVEVTGKTEVQQVRESSFNVTAVDARPLHNSTMDINQVLNKVPGIRIRESGGMGSSFNFSLNGFTGKQVKFFIDGIPMDNFGSSFQLNNIPINFAERIEIYRGVVPVWLGADALGGAVNIITSNKTNTYLDASYSYGSFNTHKTSVNTGFTNKNGLTLQLNLFQNYSDNNYWITVDAADITSGKYYRNQRLRRFNDQYHNETAVVNFGVVGKKYADKLLFGIVLGQNRAEIQTGARMVNVYGQLYRRGNMVMPTFKYQKKNFLVRGLDLTLNANYNLGEEQNVDTVNRRYNWFQQYVQRKGVGGERGYTLYKYRNNNGIVTANLNYRLSPKSTLTINNVTNYFDRRGRDELTPDNDNYEQPRKTVKNILGFGYKFDLNRRWSTSAFVKYYHQSTYYSETYNPIPGNSEIAYNKVRSRTGNLGYGIATSYFLLKNLQAKASYEHSYRLPESEELFGDMVNIDGNTSLKPENSDNYNLGLNYAPKFGKRHHLMLDANVLYRNASDFIQPLFVPNQIKTSNGNLDNVTNVSFDGEIRYSFARYFTLGANATYQNLRDNSRQGLLQGELVENFTYGYRLPNRPILFGNGYSSLSLPDLLGKGNNVSLGYNALFVDAFYLYWPSMGEKLSKKDIPRQLSHDVNMVFTFREGRYNVAFECKNLMDAQLYDNFSLQKPGRSFYVKLRYFISKKQNAS